MCVVPEDTLRYTGVYNLVRITLRAWPHLLRHRVAISLSRDGSGLDGDQLRDYWLPSRPKQLPAEFRITLEQCRGNWEGGEVRAARKYAKCTRMLKECLEVFCVA